MVNLFEKHKKFTSIPSEVDKLVAADSKFNNLWAGTLNEAISRDNLFSKIACNDLLRDLYSVSSSSSVLQNDSKTVFDLCEILFKLTVEGSMLRGLP